MRYSCAKTSLQLTTCDENGVQMSIGDLEYGTQPHQHNDRQPRPTAYLFEHPGQHHVLVHAQFDAVELRQPMQVGAHQHLWDINAQTMPRTHP